MDAGTCCDPQRRNRNFRGRGGAVRSAMLRVARAWCPKRGPTSPSWPSVSSRQPAAAASASSACSAHLVDARAEAMPMRRVQRRRLVVCTCTPRPGHPRRAPGLASCLSRRSACSTGWRGATRLGGVAGVRVDVQQGQLLCESSSWVMRAQRGAGGDERSSPSLIGVCCPSRASRTPGRRGAARPGRARAVASGDSRPGALCSLNARTGQAMRDANAQLAHLADALIGAAALHEEWHSVYRQRQPTRWATVPACDRAAAPVRQPATWWRATQEFDSRSGPRRWPSR